MTKKIFIALATILVSTLLFGADSPKVRVAYFPNITHAQALYGKGTGAYQNAVGDKYQIEWKEFNAGSAEIEAFMAGAVDIGYIGPGPAVNGFVKTKGELQIIAGASNAGAVFVTRKDLVIKNPAELSGKKIAIPQYGNTQDLSLRHIIHQAGLKETTKSGTVEIVQAENPDIKILLDNKSVDGALVPEPWGSRLVKEVGTNIYLDYKDVWRNGDYSVAVIIIKKEFLEKNKEFVEKFLATHVEITELINKDKKNAQVIINQEIKNATGKELAKDILDTAFSKVIVTYDPQNESVYQMADLSLEAGFLRSKPDLKELFDLSYINKVLTKSGRKSIN